MTPIVAKRKHFLIWLVVAFSVACQGFQTPFTSLAKVKNQRGEAPPEVSQPFPYLFKTHPTIPCSKLSDSTRCLNRKRNNKHLWLSRNNYDDGTSGTILGNLFANDERRKGILVLLTVPFAWGTFEPAVKFVYAIEPPIPGLVFSPCYYFVAASALSMLSLLSSRQDDDNPTMNSGEIEGNQHQNSFFNINTSAILGGIELGFYLFLGNSLQVLGLNTLNSDRVAFLIQLTTIFVPLVQAIAARSLFSVPPRIWAASFIALSGVFVIGLEGNEDVVLQNNLQEVGSGISSMLMSQQFLSQGDFLVIGAALCYTFHCIRLEPIAKQTKAVTLAAMKATTETVLSVLLVIGLILYGNNRGIDAAAISTSNFLEKFAMESAGDISNFFTLISERLAEGTIPVTVLLPALGACLWTGLITCGYTIYAQSYGQSRVNPSDANLIYTFQPVWTSLIAFFLLGETLGPTGFFGGGLIGLAVYLVISSDQSQELEVDGMDISESDGILLTKSEPTERRRMAETEVSSSRKQ